MPRKVFDEDLYAHFVTFSCYRRRRLLDHDETKQVVVQTLRTQLDRRQAQCFGFVIMPDHVHALLRFGSPGSLGLFMKAWKQTSSFQIKRLFRERLQQYADTLPPSNPVWQRRYYDFSIHSDQKLLEKLRYMHSNPVRAGLTS